MRKPTLRHGTASNEDDNRRGVRRSQLCAFRPFCGGGDLSASPFTYLPSVSKSPQSRDGIPRCRTAYETGTINGVCHDQNHRTNRRAGLRAAGLHHGMSVLDIAKQQGREGELTNRWDIDTFFSTDEEGLSWILAEQEKGAERYGGNLTLTFEL